MFISDARVDAGGAFFEMEGAKIYCSSLGVAQLLVERLRVLVRRRMQRCERWQRLMVDREARRRLARTVARGVAFPGSAVAWLGLLWMLLAQPVQRHRCGADRDDELAELQDEVEALCLTAVGAVVVRDHGLVFADIAVLARCVGCSVDPLSGLAAVALAAERQRHAGGGSAGVDVDGDAVRVGNIEVPRG